MKKFQSFLLTATLVLSSPWPLLAQAQDLPKNDAQIAKFEGTIEDGQGNMLQVINDKSEKRVITLPKDLTRVRYSAEALPEWLTPGLFIRLSTEMNNQGKASGPLATLEVFMPDPPQRLRHMQPEALRRQVPGIYPAGAAAGTDLFNIQNQAAVANGGVQKYDVVGQLIGFQQGFLGIQCGDVALQFAIDEKTKIHVDAYGLDLVQKGDKVSVTGLSSPKTPENIVASSITISPVKPLGTKTDPVDGKEGDKSIGKKKLKTTKPPKRSKPPTDDDG